MEGWEREVTAARAGECRTGLIGEGWLGSEGEREGAFLRAVPAECEATDAG